MVTYARSRKDANDIRAYFNNSASVTLAKGRVVVGDTGRDHIKYPAADTDKVKGVCINDIPPKTWGDVQVRGTAKCVAAGALATPHVQLKADTAGKVVAWAASAGAVAHLVGSLESLAGADGDLVEVELAGPGIMQQAAD